MKSFIIFIRRSLHFSVSEEHLMRQSLCVCARACPSPLLTISHPGCPYELGNPKDFSKGEASPEASTPSDPTPPGASTLRFDPAGLFPPRSLPTTYCPRTSAVLGFGNAGSYASSGHASPATSPSPAFLLAGA